MAKKSKRDQEIDEEVARIFAEMEGAPPVPRIEDAEEDASEMTTSQKIDAINDFLGIDGEAVIEAMAQESGITIEMARLQDEAFRSGFVKLEDFARAVIAGTATLTEENSPEMAEYIDGLREAQKIDAGSGATTVVVSEEMRDYIRGRASETEVIRVEPDPKPKRKRKAPKATEVVADAGTTEDATEEPVAGMSVPKTVSEARQQIIDQSQVDEDKLRTVRLNWAEYMKTGVLPKLSCARWRASDRLESSDLGINAVESDKFKLGTKMLSPRISEDSKFFNPNKPDRTYAKFFDTVERAARSRLKNLCLITPFGLFLPLGNFSKWLDSFQDYKDQAFEMVAEMVERWDVITELILGEYVSDARSAYARYCKINNVPVSAEGQEFFIDDYMSHIRAALPSAEEFAMRFQFEDSYTFVPLPTMLASEMAKADDIRKNSEVNYELRSVEAQRLRAERLELEEANDALEQKIERAQRDILAKAEAAAAEQGAQMVDDFMVQMRQRILTVAKRALDAVENSGKLGGRNVVSIKQMVEWARDVNTGLGDAQISAMTDEIQNALDGNGVQGETLTDVMRRIAGYCEVQIDGLSREGRLEADYDIEPFEDDEDVRTGRDEEEIEEVPVLDSGRRGRFAEIVV